MNAALKAFLIILCVIVVFVLAAVIAITTTWSGARFPQPSPGQPQAAEEDEKPDVYIIANETEIEVDETVQFELGGNRGDRPVTAEWDFGDGSELSNKKNPKHKYKVKGKFEVTLKVIDADGDEDTEEKNIVVKDPEATDSNGDTSGGTDGGSDGGSNRIPVYNPYYFLIAFLMLMTISMVLLKKRVS